ncbi:hypothetical protein TNIN_5391 [Trichonephila inaurata madagascariensis]|uniref:Uncharacterized protein n=1 Tax=Trichonephila inaurata madagascariensis TaxID=2747483 RepID=A0A8X6YQL6_9ARAC|nr:hypothetical protein TNIN_5391 [Trichonephila inaurata madagascariensis]
MESFQTPRARAGNQSVASPREVPGRGVTGNESVPEMTGLVSENSFKDRRQQNQSNQQTWQRFELSPSSERSFRAFQHRNSASYRSLHAYLFADLAPDSVGEQTLVSELISFCLPAIAQLCARSGYFDSASNLLTWTELWLPLMTCGLDSKWNCLPRSNTIFTFQIRDY